MRASCAALPRRKDGRSRPRWVPTCGKPHARTAEAVDAEYIGPAGHAKAPRPRRGAWRRSGRRSTRASQPDRRTASHAWRSGPGSGRHRCNRICLVEGGRAPALRPAIGGDLAQDGAAPASRRGVGSAPARTWRAQGRGQGPHGSATSGGSHHRDREGGRAGIATQRSGSILVLEPGSARSRNPKAAALGHGSTGAAATPGRASLIPHVARARFASHGSALARPHGRCHLRAMAAWS